MDSGCRQRDGKEIGTVGESRKIAIPDEMEFWYFIQRVYLANSNGVRARGTRARPSVICAKDSLHVSIYTYLEKIANNGRCSMTETRRRLNELYKRSRFNVAKEVPSVCSKREKKIDS